MSEEPGTATREGAGMQPGDPWGGYGVAAWAGVRVCVAGLGVSGVPAARALLARGAAVTVVDDRDGEEERRSGAELARLGASVRLGGAGHLPADTEIVVTSPGWRPTSPLLAAAKAAGIPVIGEVELAWQLRPGSPATWLAVTGTNGKTSTVRMLASMLCAAGARACAAGNVGTPLLDAVLAEPPWEVLAVELSSFQLHWSHSPRPLAAAVLNVAPDHLDWHGSVDTYAADKGRIFAPGTLAVHNADDPVSTALAAGSEHRVSFTLESPTAGQLGVAQGMLRDRAFADDVELAAVEDVAPAAPHNVANALAAAALARAYGVAPDAVREGLREFQPDAHRIASVATVGGVRYVDDSKATNPHAAAASLGAYSHAVWIGGGQLKGADVEELITSSASRLRAAVLIGEDRAVIREAFARHAPNVPLVDIDRDDTGAMDNAVREAADLARPGDTVLLAPAGASFDMFTSYSARGDAFAAAVRLLAEDRP